MCTMYINRAWVLKLLPLKNPPINFFQLYIQRVLLTFRPRNHRGGIHLHNLSGQLWSFNFSFSSACCGVFDGHWGLEACITWSRTWRGCSSRPHQPQRNLRLSFFDEAWAWWGLDTFSFCSIYEEGSFSDRSIKYFSDCNWFKWNQE